MSYEKENLLYLTGISLKLVGSADINKYLSDLSLFFLFWKDFPTAAHYKLKCTFVCVISQRHEKNIKGKHELSLNTEIYT